MGTIDFQQPIVSTKTNMKLFIIAAVLIASVVAEPESEAKAEPWLTYANYGYAGYPYAARTYAAGAYPYAGVYGLGYDGYATGYGHYLGKRSADSEPESWYGNYGYGYAPYTAGYRSAVYSPYTYGAYAGYGYNGYAYGK